MASLEQTINENQNSKSKPSYDYENVDLFKQMMNPNNPVGSIRTLMGFGIGNPQIIGPQLEKVNMLVEGGELIQAAICCNDSEMLKYFISKGARADHPPQTVTKMIKDPKKLTENYRKAPFIIQAACAGDTKCYETLLSQGCKTSEQGYICLSKKRKNMVTSNVIGAAAYHNSVEFLKKYLPKLKTELNINFPAQEKHDLAQKGNFNKEFAGFTPLMLAIAGGDKNLEVLNLLLQAKADTSIKDANDNNIIHIATKYECPKILQFLIEHSNVSFLDRNKKGETPLSIATEKKNERLIEILKKVQERSDPSKQTCDDLLEELTKEESKMQEKKEKKKQKNKRAQIRKLAEKEGVSYEEMEQRLKLQQEEERQKEEQDRLREEEREKEEIEMEKREKEDRLRKLEEQRRKQEKKQAKLLKEQQIKDTQERGEDVDKQQIGQSSKTATSSQKLQNESNQQQQVVETTFAYVKAKRPTAEEELKKKQQEEKNQQQKEVAEKEKEQDKAKLSQQNKEGQTNRKQRKQQERQLQMQQRKQAAEALKEKQVQEGTGSQSSEYDGDEEEEEVAAANNQNEQQVVVGLGADLLLKATQNKKAKRRLRKKMKQQQEEEEKQKEMMRKMYEKQEAEKKRLEQEEEDRKRAEEERKKAEEEEKNKKFTYFKKEPQLQYRPKVESKQYEKKDKGRNKENEKQQIYRPKVKKAEENEQDQKKVEVESQQQQQQIQEEKENKIQGKDLNYYVGEYEESDSENYENNNNANKVNEIQETKQVQFNDTKQLEQNQYKVHQQETNQETVHLKTPPSSPLPQFVNATQQQHLPQPNFVLQPNAAFQGGYPVGMNIFHQIATTELLQQNQQLLALQLSDPDGAQRMKYQQEISMLNEHLQKERNLNKYFQTQLIETEKNYHDEKARREDIEKRLLQQVALNQALQQEKSQSELSSLEDLEKKQSVIKALNKKIDAYEGKSFEGLSKEELLNISRQISDTIIKIHSKFSLK